MAKVNANRDSYSEIKFQMENHLIYGMTYAQIAK